MNSDYEQNQQDLLFLVISRLRTILRVEPTEPTFFMIFGPNMSSNIIKLYMDGF